MLPANDKWPLAFVVPAVATATVTLWALIYAAVAAVF